MSVIYNSQYVDEKYSAIIEPNLYYDSVLQPGITYTDKYTEKAGGIFIHKLANLGAITPTTPAGDFTHTNSADALIQAVFNNSFRKSESIYGVSQNAVSYNMGEAKLQEVMLGITESWQISGLACLGYEATDYADTTALSTTNLKDYWLAMRKYLRKTKKAKANFGIVSSDVFELYLKIVGDDYTPLFNDEIMRTGRGGIWYGIPIIEANALALTSAKYYDYTGNLRTVDLSLLDIIMGDYEAFSILNNFESFQLVDGAPNMNGTYAQGEMNVAFRVTNADRIIVKKNTGASV